VENFQGAHHKDHEGVGEFKDTQLELGESFFPISETINRGNDADSHENKDSAHTPCRGCIYIDNIKQHLAAMLVIFVGSGHNQSKVTVVVNQQNEHANQPLIGQKAEQNQEN